MTKPRLLIDASAGFNQGAGIGRYARCLIGATYPALADRFDIRLWYASDTEGEPPFAEAMLATAPDDALDRVHRSRLSRRRIDQLGRLPIPVPALLVAGRFDACYSPDFTVPGASRRPTVVTVHDLAFEIVPDAYPLGLLQYLRTVVPRSVRRATMVAAVSETTRTDLIARYDISLDRVVVIPNAAAERFFDARPLAEADRLTLRVPEDYLLAVGTIEPRKNYRTLLEAQEDAYAVTARPLVIAGRSGWHNGDEMRLIHELTSTGAAIPLLDVSDEFLPGLYAGAHALAYVPRYEGFGLPVLEAMAAGTAVVASAIPSIREFTGGHALLVDGTSVADICEGLISVARASSEESARLKAAARRYDWQRSGTILVDTIAHALEHA